MSLPAQAEGEGPLVYTLAEGFSMNIRTSLGRACFVPLFTSREHLRRVWVRVLGPCLHLLGLPPEARWPAPTAMLPAQAFAAGYRRHLWLDCRRHDRLLQREAWADSRRAKALGGAIDGAAQAPGLTGALAPVADAAVWTGTRIGDGFMGLWDRALAMMPEGAAPPGAS